MKHLGIFVGLVFNLIFIKYNAQIGCTDPQANNFSPTATVNNGSCTYDLTISNYQTKGPINIFAVESSGVQYDNGVIWTHNDSGNANEIFKADTTTGNLLQRVTISNAANNDWEDITSDSSYIYVGDFGNNNGTRTDLKVLKIDKAQLTNTAAVISVTAQIINFSYADQTSFTSNGSTNFDCESMFSLNGSLYLFTKDRGDFQTRVYRLSKTPGTYTLSPYTSYNVNGKITGADYNKQKKEVVLIGYMSSSRNSFFYFLNDFTSDLFFSGNKRRIELGNSTNDWQTEGVSYGINANELFFSCETSYTPATLYGTNRNMMLILGLNEKVVKENQIKVYPNPSNAILNIESSEEIKELELLTLDGRNIYQIFPNQFLTKMDVGQFTTQLNGCYFLKIKTASETFYKKVFFNLN